MLMLSWRAKKIFFNFYSFSNFVCYKFETYNNAPRNNAFKSFDGMCNKNKFFTVGIFVSLIISGAGCTFLFHFRISHIFKVNNLLFKNKIQFTILATQACMKPLSLRKILIFSVRSCDQVFPFLAVSFGNVIYTLLCFVSFKEFMF